MLNLIVFRWTVFVGLPQTNCQIASAVLQFCNKYVKYSLREKLPLNSDDIDWSPEVLSAADDVRGEEKRSSTRGKIAPLSGDTSLAVFVTS